MDDDFIDKALAQFAQFREKPPTRLPMPEKLAWRVIESGDVGLLRGALDADGDLVLQNLNMHTEFTAQFWIPRAAFPALRALLETPHD